MRLGSRLRDAPKARWHEAIWGAAGRKKWDAHIFFHILSFSAARGLAMSHVYAARSRPEVRIHSANTKTLNTMVMAK